MTLRYIIFIMYTKAPMLSSNYIYPYVYLNIGECNLFILETALSVEPKGLLFFVKNKELLYR